MTIGGVQAVMALMLVCNGIVTSIQGSRKGDVKDSVLTVCNCGVCRGAGEGQGGGSGEPG